MRGHHVTTSSPHRVVDLSSIVPKTMLTDKGQKIPNISYSDIEGVSPTYVPFRNGLLLSAITSIVHGEYVTHGPGRGAMDSKDRMGNLLWCSCRRCPELGISRLHARIYWLRWPMPFTLEPIGL